jgi:hypothetical protein
MAYPCLRSQDFSTILTKAAIERLAEADEYEVVREVQVSVTHGKGQRLI